ncbi:AfsR/SARP family transcriptional regulator [Streptomyces graminilatus]|uniref:AfsR/SARP family transcriptional regulator n=1 Tax=Streptomyces graminilatus TaxID=1464070 RepID=UPI0006E2F426|nr:AfsR/SARP family transcriptional regulator [Streptomyces graminilatus]
MIARVLGTLDVRVDGYSVVPTAPKPRKVLGLLVLHANHVVSTSALMRELWGEKPPASAATTLQTYILLLRKLLAAALAGGMPEAKRMLATYPGGYKLQLPCDAVDLDRFEELCAAGRQFLARGEAREAADTLRAALALWRDDALVDVPTGPLLEVEAVRLRECRLGALEQRIEADLRLGRHHEVLSELAALVAEFPLNENLHAQLMLALYRSGRRAQALGVYRKLRTSFIDELGLDPSTRIHDLHQAVLASEPALDAEAAQQGRPATESARLVGVV